MGARHEAHQANMLNMVATIVKNPMTMYGAALVSKAASAPLALESEPEPEAVAELPDPVAPLLPLAVPEAADEVTVKP